MNLQEVELLLERPPGDYRTVVGNRLDWRRFATNSWGRLDHQRGAVVDWDTDNGLIQVSFDQTSRVEGEAFFEPSQRYSLFDATYEKIRRWLR